MNRLLAVKINKPLLGVLGLGAFLRFYRLRELTTFGGDQGIDYLNVARMLVEKRPTLLGPVTHVGIYLGPLYYYLLTPFFYLFNFDPIAAPFMFALFGSATLILVYLLAQKILSRQLALAATLLYATSPLIIESSRSPSQPHLIPLFSALLLVSLLNVLKGKASQLNSLAIGIALGTSIQLHYLTFPLFILTGLALFSSKDRQKYFRLGFLLPATIAFLILILPWILFEFRHQFFITHQIINYLKSGEVGANPSTLANHSVRLLWFAFQKLVSGEINWLSTLVISLTAYAVFRYRKNRQLAFLTAFLLINLIGIAFYFDPFFNHYISSIYPAVIILTVFGLGKIFSQRLAVILTLALVLLNLKAYDYKRHQGYTMPKGLTTSVIQTAAKVVSNDTPTEKFQIANTLDGDTRGQPYRYLLEIVHQKPPLEVHQYPEAEVLYVIGRNNSDQIVNHQVWEISSFNPKRVAKSWQVGDNVFVYRLEQ